MSPSNIDHMTVTSPSLEVPMLLQGQKASPDHIRVERYKQSRYWAVWVGDRLLAVTVYKKGALAIRDTLLPTAAG